MEEMLKSKAAMLAGSVIGAFILIYGTAILFNLFFGAYMLQGGLADWKYGMLALLCAMPFVLITLFGRSDRSSKYAIFAGAVLFSVLFVIVHLMMVLSAEAMQDDAAERVLIVFPVSALILAVVLYFTARNEIVS
ncbi:hypothetical protein [Planomicrobium sp. YIM 101495]|uniref:hypothetical protein n=1 Tax=Planomicrobium sp. YIM 101495 TaxID=2665160 RepID=UPI0018AA4BA6|nr:hypothetical protein [Planomicrobium sp. YIM 101495]